MEAKPHGWYVVKAREAVKRNLRIVPSADYQAHFFKSQMGSYEQLTITVVSGYERLLVFRGAAGILAPSGISGDGKAIRFGFLHDGPWIDDITAHYLSIEAQIDARDGAGAVLSEPPKQVSLVEAEAERAERMRKHITDKRGIDIKAAVDAIEAKGK